MGSILAAILVMCMAISSQAFSADELALRNAILEGTRLVLKKDVVLSANLPQLAGGKTVTLVGAKNGGSRPVRIDGKGRFTMFKSAGTGSVMLSLTNLIIQGSQPLVNGFPAAAVDISDIGSRLTINKVNFVSNARAIYVGGTVATISNSQFNKCTKTAVVVVPVPGGGVPLVTFTKCTFTGNKADDLIGGGAIHVGNGESDRANIAVTGSTFNQNSAQGSVGGAVRLMEFSIGTFRGCTFRGNSAPDGGAIAAFNARFTTVNCRFNDNRGGVGGAVRMRSDGEGRNSLSRTSFSGNRASIDGGAFVINQDVDLTLCRCKFEKNTARDVENNVFVEGCCSGVSVGTDPPFQIPLVTYERPDTDNITYFRDRCVA